MLVYVMAFIISAIFLYFAKKEYNSYIEYKELYLLDNTVYNIRRRNDYYLKYVFFIFIAILVLGFITGFRASSVGTDLEYTYFPNFNKMIRGENGDYEAGFNFLIKFIQLFSSDPQSLTLVTSLIFVSVLFIVSIRFSKNYFVSIIVVLLSTIYFISLNNVRQSIACILMVAAYTFLVDRKIIKFMIMVIIGTLFHTTCLIMIPVYFFVNWRFIKKHFLIIALGITVAIPILSGTVIAILMHTKYAYFITSAFNNGKANLGNIALGLVFFIISFILLYKERYDKKESYTLLVMQFFSFIISFLSLFIPASEMVSRVAYYFIFYQLLLIPYLYEREYAKLGKGVLISFYILIYGSYMIYYIIIMGYHNVLPYVLCF